MRIWRRHIGCAVLAVIAVAAIALPASASPTGGVNGNVPPEKIARDHLARLGKGYSARIDRTRRIIFISALDDKTLDDTILAMAAYADAQRRGLLRSRPKWYLTVILPTVDDYKPPRGLSTATGYYQPSTRTLTSIDRGTTLVHEFTHALHDADQSAARQRHPLWIWEGLATTFERTRIHDGKFVVPLVDSRLATLQQALRNGTAPSLAALAAMDQAAFMADVGVNYAMARYVMVYLRRRGLLQRWYQAYKATFANDPSGLDALKRVLGQSNDAFEKTWRTWVLSMEAPAARKWQGAAKLGIEMQKHPRGVKIVGMLESGAAAQAGRLRIGDVIVAYNGQSAGNPAQLGAIIRATGAMKTVRIEILRRGRRRTIVQPLGAVRS